MTKDEEWLERKKADNFKKEWQGLSDDEIETIDINVIERLVDDEILEFARAIEAKLKEKNS